MMVVMTLLLRSAKQPADFVWSHIGDYFTSGAERISDTLQMMCRHHTEHHLLVHRQGDIDMPFFDHCRPMLVTDGMSQLHCTVHNLFSRSSFQATEVYHHHLIQFYTEYYCTSGFRFIENDVTIAHPGMPVESHRELLPINAPKQETALLGCPLVYAEIFHIQRCQSLPPFGRVYVSYNMVVYHNNQSVFS